MVRHRSRKRLPKSLRAIILFKLEQLSILTVCFSGTTHRSAISARRCAQSRLRLNLAAVSSKLLCRSAWLRIFVVGCSLPCDPPAGGHSCNGDDTTLYGCALDEYTGREGAPPCCAMQGENPKTR